MRPVHLLFALFSVSAFAWANDAVHDYTLGNGMRVIVKEDHRAPIVVSQVWYRVGASYEPDGITGISHALEHMMFKGTPKHGPGEFSGVIAANGGEENAFTSRDYTVYHQTLSRDRLEIAFELEADRMRNLLLAPEEFAKEIEVVKEERRLRTEDRPNALTYEQFNAIAYRVLPYRNPVIGWMGDLERMTAADLKEWYRLWYAPNNTTLVVVGDVAADRILALAKKHFGPLKAETKPRVRSLQEPPQRGLIRTVVRAPAREPYLLLGYHTPVVGSAAGEWEPYALLMLAGILDGGSSARLSRELVRGRELAVTAGAGYDPFSRFPEMLVLSGVPRAGHTVAELETALREEIERLRTDLVSPEELERVRAQVVAGEVYKLDSINYQAMQLGTLVSLGLDWRLLDRYVERMNAVTAEQVREVARKYLTDDKLVVATLEPLPIPQQPGSQPVRQQEGDDVR